MSSLRSIWQNRLNFFRNQRPRPITAFRGRRPPGRSRLLSWTNTRKPFPQPWQSIFDALSEAVCLLDLEGRILNYNRAMIKFLNKPTGSIIGLFLLPTGSWPSGTHPRVPGQPHAAKPTERNAPVVVKWPHPELQRRSHLRRVRTFDRSRPYPLGNYRRALKWMMDSGNTPPGSGRAFPGTADRPGPAPPARPEFAGGSGSGAMPDRPGITGCDRAGPPHRQTQSPGRPGLSRHLWILRSR